MQRLLPNLIPIWFADLRTALSEMTRLDITAHLFWAFGLCTLLIERSPADVYISLCGLIFIFRCLAFRNFDWLKVFWVQTTLCFWFVCIVAACFSDIPGHSLPEAIIWIRFPLFAFATVFWFASDERLFNFILGFSIALMIVMCCVLISEFIIEGQKGGRLLWPYGDPVPGNYLAKAALPAFLALISWMEGKNRSIIVLCAFIVSLSLVASILTGERMNLILKLCAGSIAIFLVLKSSGRSLVLIMLILCILVGFLILNPALVDRYIFQFFNELPIHSNSPYLMAWNGGGHAFMSSPILGIGPDGYRILCDPLFSELANVKCHPHPHNFFIQISAETGLLGLISGSLMMGSIFWTCLKFRWTPNVSRFGFLAFIVPMSFFFPIQSTADFFGQWNNAFMWSALALSLASGNAFTKKSKS